MHFSPDIYIYQTRSISSLWFVNHSLSLVRSLSLPTVAVQSSTHPVLVVIISTSIHMNRHFFSSIFFTCHTHTYVYICVYFFIRCPWVLSDRILFKIDLSIVRCDKIFKEKKKPQKKWRIVERFNTLFQSTIEEEENWFRFFFFEILWLLLLILLFTF